MKIKKIDEVTCYSVINKEHTYEVNGKTIKVFSHDQQSTYGDDQYDTNIDESCVGLLTEDEEELFNDNVIGNYDLLKVGQELEIKE